ncbi:spermine/spermidine synthase [Alkalihalobacillus alcalophilus ATCC 27647 = CGMCC 1.3604]|uniref:Spermine/spermidine synthase n=1 Tax=Alkalihalobacillus alcalophilus ATCC 27647 = CGMCC 1.3604 TaxID=1218173 RepID=A0A094XCF8_ALKAL|nr:spermine/spermidine synthase [Alkalihalobacillus alcalophilus]KGA96485.1 spermine/spermidine synthase [Alkalihalobacillus alcalophilus ATCC 27647 = CGMCC 1.3604]MED1562308.1 spermine/spermidine synthase [Alkalihalobacillus alcalophilus]THG88379.1 spermine/spermidine synthase [Alkalihalobacillus alcalophilus ATCC 27647 = CGMCC 1.3604]
MRSLPEVIERCSTDRGEIQLQKRDEQFEIIYNGTFLMATYNGDSERLLVKAALDSVAEPNRVLIGGLGVGFSLAEALVDPRVRQVDVVEIEQVIIEWNDYHLSGFNSRAIDDPRTNIIHADLLKYVQETVVKYDVICLDIDNGPDWIVAEPNNGLYSDRGIEQLMRILSKKGILSFWSATESAAFVQKLRTYFAFVEVKKVTQPKGEPDYVYICSGIGGF